MLDSPHLLTAALKQVLERRETLSRVVARDLMRAVLTGDADGQEASLAALLGGLAARGETTEELAGFVDALRASAIRVPLTDDERALMVDTCGTGGDLSGTFNISTAAALVAAAAGAKVAKHGNRAVTSRCGSADVLEALGIAVDLTPDQAATSLREHGFAFLPAPALQPAMRAVMPLRRALGVRTAFNILGPMTNPAGAPAQVLGVYAARLVPVVAATLALIETRHAFVVHGSVGSADLPGMDEFSLSGPTQVAEVRGRVVSHSVVTPAHFGFDVTPIESLAGGNAEENAAMLRGIFDGQPGPPSDVVQMNAGAVLVTAGLAENFLAGAKLAGATIAAGKVARLVHTLASKKH